MFSERGFRPSPNRRRSFPNTDALAFTRCSSTNRCESVSWEASRIVADHVEDSHIQKSLKHCATCPDQGGEE
jgi:hypothetical protein